MTADEEKNFSLSIPVLRAIFLSYSILNRGQMPHHMSKLEKSSGYDKLINIINNSQEMVPLKMKITYLVLLCKYIVSSLSYLHTCR